MRFRIVIVCVPGNTKRIEHVVYYAGRCIKLPFCATILILNIALIGDSTQYIYTQLIEVIATEQGIQAHNGLFVRCEPVVKFMMVEKIAVIDVDTIIYFFDELEKRMMYTVLQSSTRF